jgi:hypothetical protein
MTDVELARYRLAINGNDIILRKCEDNENE